MGKTSETVTNDDDVLGRSDVGTWGILVIVVEVLENTDGRV